ncbi:F-box/WD repeat-containing protein 9-like [Diretmus argenteus]
MSEVRVDVTEQKAGTERVRTEVDQDQDPPPLDPVKPPTGETSRPDLQGLLPGGRPSSTEPSPSPSAEGSGLLSLPWELVTHIASYLSAQCVITVLPKVCHVLGNLGKDSVAWQLRARRLTGSGAGFPVGPKEDFNWPNACLEMEQLITCWAGQADLDGEDGDIQQNVGGDVLLRVREEVEWRPEERVASLMLGERGPRAVVDAVDGREGAFDQIDHQEDLVDPRHLSDRGEVDRGQSPRSPSPPPALERMTLPLQNADICSVLLVGGEGRVCATGSQDMKVKLWDLQVGSRGTLLRALGGQGHTHQGWVVCLAYRGPLLASGSLGGTVRLWDLEAGGAARGLIRTGFAPHCLSFQTDVLLAGTSHNRINMYDTRVAEPLVKSLRLHSSHGDAVRCLAADDNYIISGSTDCTVAVYDRRAGKALKKLQLSSFLSSMSYSGSEVWAGDHRGMLHAFSMQAGVFKHLSQFDVGHTSRITGIHRSPGSLYTCSCDETVKVHLPSAPPRTLCTLLQQDWVYGLSVEAGVLAVASGDFWLSRVQVWRPRR